MTIQLIIEFGLRCWSCDYISRFNGWLKGFNHSYANTLILDYSSVCTLFDRLDDFVILVNHFD